MYGNKEVTSANISNHNQICLSAVYNIHKQTSSENRKSVLNYLQDTRFCGEVKNFKLDVRVS